MFRRLVLIFSVVAMGLALNGCTKCGPIWDDWVQSPKSCKSDRSRTALDPKWAGALGVAADAVIYCPQYAGSFPMRILGAAAVIVLLTGPAYAQTPNINLIPETAIQVAGGEGSRRGKGQGLQGIAEEDSGCQGVFRSVGQCAQHRYAEDGGSRQAAHQNRQHHELERSYGLRPRLRTDAASRAMKFLTQRSSDADMPSCAAGIEAAVRPWFRRPEFEVGVCVMRALVLS